MVETEAFFGVSSIHLSIIGVLISLCSLLVASFLAWRTKFSPPKLVGSFSYLVIWRFGKNNKERSEDIYVVPFIWLSNIGAKPILIGDIRMKLITAEENEIILSPNHTVPMEAIEKPNTISDFELIRLGEAPFSGFSIAYSEQWKNNNAFQITPEMRALLKGNVEVVLEICKLGTSKFKPAVSENIDFDHKGFEWASLGEPEADYYYKIKPP